MIDFRKVFNSVAPMIAIALAGAVAGCGGNIKINGEEGVPLAELDLEGAAPTALNLMGPDTVNITEGDALAIEVSGEAAEHIRFVLDDGSLSVLRDESNWDGGSAVIAVTMPAPASLTLAGSGAINSATLANKADVVILGSGKVSASSVEVDTLDVSIAGSGSLSAAGSARALDLNIAGSGDVKLAGMKIETADINVAGSGNAEFASDGTVEANFMGSGNVTVTGSATCTMNGFGSGTLRCQSGTASSSTESN